MRAALVFFAYEQGFWRWHIHRWARCGIAIAAVWFAERLLWVWILESRMLTQSLLGCRVASAGVLIFSLLRAACIGCLALTQRHPLWSVAISWWALRLAAWAGDPLFACSMRVQGS